MMLFWVKIFHYTQYYHDPRMQNVEYAARNGPENNELHICVDAVGLGCQCQHNKARRLQKIPIRERYDRPLCRK